MESKRIYPPTQLVVALDSKVLKTYLWILGWTTKGDLKYYPKQFAKACKMDETEVEQCIQALIDSKLISATLIEETWVLSPNAEQNQKYYDVPISKVIEGKGILPNEKVTWNTVGVPSKRNDMDDMSEDEMKKMVLMLQARLKERAEVQKRVVSMTNPINNDIDDLPF